MFDYSKINFAQKYSEEDSFTAERYEQFLKYFKHSDINIIDIGCNTGRGGEELRKRKQTINLIGIDVVKCRLESVKDSIYNFLLLASATNIPFKSYSYDIILGGEFIEHIRKEDISAVLSEFNRILKNGGRLMLTTPNPNSLLVKIGRDDVMKAPSHFSIMSKKDLKNKLLLSGFDNIIIKGSGKGTRLFGEDFFFFPVYGSYLVIAEKSH
jgi:SAM-dependent methyltransferase